MTADENRLLAVAQDIGPLDAAIAFVRGLGEHVEFSEDEDTMDLTVFF